MTELINRFADKCNETTGASFTISKLKTGKWKISFVNLQDRFFSSFDLEEALHAAELWLETARRPVEVETKYTLYINR